MKSDFGGPGWTTGSGGGTGAGTGLTGIGGGVTVGEAGAEVTRTRTPRGGTLIVVLQLGHAADRPALLSGADDVAPHDGQANRIATDVSGLARGQSWLDYPVGRGSTGTTYIILGGCGPQHAIGVARERDTL